MQNCRNSLTAGRLDDDLELKTEVLPCNPDSSKKKNAKEQQDRRKIEDHLDSQLTELIVDLPGQNQNANQQETYSLENLISMDKQKNKAATLKIASVMSTSQDSHFIEELDRNEINDRRKRQKTSHETKDNRCFVPDVNRMVWLYQRSVLRHNDATVTSTVLANGSAKSIISYAKHVFRDKSAISGIDKNQCQAFISCISDFVLTYVEDAIRCSESARHELVKWKSDLLKLRGLPRVHKHNRMIMFMTGPGGAGKSYVLQQILNYAQLFCDEINQPFDKKTIVVTA